MPLPYLLPGVLIAFGLFRIAQTALPSGQAVMRFYRWRGCFQSSFLWANTKQND